MIQILAHARRAGVLSIVAAATLSFLAAVTPEPAGAVGTGTDQSTLVSAVPAAYTPNITNGTVDAITQVGELTIVGGSFTSVQNHGSTSTLSRPYVLAFNTGTGAVSTTFSPALDGIVESAQPGPTANTVYVGGYFNTVNGTRSKGITLLDTQTGATVVGFKPPNLNGVVFSIAPAPNAHRLFIGGSFTTAAGAARGGFASLDPATGALDSFADITFAGHHNYDGSGANGAVGPRAMSMNPAGTTLMVVGNFKTAGGLPRDQIAMIDVDGSSAAVDTGWATLKYTAACFQRSFDTYVTDVQWAPDGSYFAVTATGGSGTNSDGTRSLCDSASRWEGGATGNDVAPTWVDYTGQDTLWSVATTGTAIYVGGHQRWLNNSNGFDHPGAGAVPRPGLAALSPDSGLPLAWNPGRNPRGAGAYALFASADGVSVGSDTDYIGNRKYLHRKIAYFPLRGGTVPASTATTSLPANLYRAGQLPAGANANDLTYRAVDGSQIGASTTVPDTGVAWGSTRGAFMVGNDIFYPSTDGNFHQAAFDGTTVGPPAVVDPYDDPTWSSVQTGSGQTYQGVKPGYYSSISSITGEFYTAGRLYYALAGKSSLHWRYFNPDSGIIGSADNTVSGGNFANIAGMVLSKDTLYFADRFTGYLHSEAFTNGTPDKSTDTVVSGPGDGLDWRARGMFLDGSAAPANRLPTASATSSCNGSTCSFDGSKSSDPDGTIRSWAWDFGDGSTGTGATPTHTYTDPGSYTVTLKVTDDQGGVSAPWSGTVTIAGTPPPSSSDVGFVGKAGYNGLSANPSVTMPAGISAGDTELLFVTANTTGVTGDTPTGQSGWSQIGRQTSSPLQTTVFRRTAAAGDSGDTVTVPLSAAYRVDLGLVVYSNVAAATAPLATAGDANKTKHAAPGIDVPDAGSWVLSYWSIRASTDITWATPSTVTVRATGVGAKGGHVDAITGDSGAPVGAGGYPAQTATSSSSGGKGDMITIVLAPAA